MPTVSTLISNPAPLFNLPCTRFSDPGKSRVDLADYRGRWLVLVFYPSDFSLVCPTELIGLSQRFDEFAEHGCDLLGISCDSVESHERWIATPISRGGLGGLSFPLASDLDGSVARSYGVYQERQRVAVRGLFIIDPDGLVQYHVVHNLSVGRRSQEVLRVLAALQSGGLCREDWMADHQTFDPFKALRPGNYFSHYLIEDEAGSGTFAKVYRARDLQLDRSVALKVFKPDCPVTPSAALAEARAAAALNHPNLCTIYAVDDTAGVPIISMEYIAGLSLSKIGRDGPPPLEVAAVDRSPDRRGNGGRPCRRHRARRPQAGKRHGRRRWTGQGPRLRPGATLAARSAASHRRNGRAGSRRDRRRTLRHSAVPVPRAGPRRASHDGQRRLRFRCGPLRARHFANTAFQADNLFQVLDQIRSVNPDTMATETPEPFASLLRQLLIADPGQRTITMKDVADT